MAIAMLVYDCIFRDITRGGEHRVQEEKRSSIDDLVLNKMVVRIPVYDLRFAKG